MLFLLVIETSRKKYNDKILYTYNLNAQLSVILLLLPVVVVVVVVVEEVFIRYLFGCYDCDVDEPIIVCE